MNRPIPPSAPDDTASLIEFDPTTAERLAGLGYVVFCADSMCGDPSATEAYFAALRSVCLLDGARAEHRA